MTAFAQTLKSWRRLRRFSQLELACEAEVSSRHLSFLETGRASPSRDMIRRLGDALDLPLAARNQLLSHAGFAARYGGRNWDDDDMLPIRRAVGYMLERHAPYPGFAADRHWNILKMNAPARHLFGAFGTTEGTNLIASMQREDVQGAILNWPDVARHLAHRLRTESAWLGGIAEFEAAAEGFAKAERPERASVGPVVPTVFALGPARLSLFSTIAQFGTPDDLALDDLKIELFFPADEASEALLREMDVSLRSGP